MNRVACWVAVLVLAGCGGSSMVEDGGGGGDAGVMPRDAGAGGGTGDAGAVDGGLPDAGDVDGGVLDGGAPDAGDMDGGVLDGGVPDAGDVDGGVPDAGTADAGAGDAGVADAGVLDAGLQDAGTTDAGGLDAGTSDAGMPDAGVPDAGPVDAGTCADFGCSSGLCCDAVCVDTMSSNTHCGGCNQPCAPPGANMVAACSTGACQTACNPGFFDCDGVSLNGCESMTACACTPGSTASCYSGPLGTQNVGVCRGGSKTCAANGLGYGACQGEVVPGAEVCGDNLDNDCNGARDDSLDVDGDGYTKCDGDLCDDLSCPNAIFINPGAFEVAGNQVDDDCDGQIDEAAVPCDMGLTSSSAAASDAAKAMGLCQLITAQQRTWGVLSAAYKATGGTTTPAPAAHALRAQFGANQPQEGSALVVLSTGKAAAPADGADYDASQSTNFSLTAPLPADWLAANNGLVPVPPGCPRVGSTQAYDPMVLELRVRVPTNARSFSLKANYFTSDYAEYVCSPYVDQFVVLLDSQYQPQGTEPANPSHKNLAVSASDLVTPLSTRFSQCVNGATGCASGASPGMYNACVGTAGLVGTGFDTAQAGQCNVASLRGGATGWLHVAGNVIPGETITLRIGVWDSGDGTLDSTLVLDHFEWSTTPVTPGG